MQAEEEAVSNLSSEAESENGGGYIVGEIQHTPNLPKLATDDGRSHKKSKGGYKSHTAQDMRQDDVSDMVTLKMCAQLAQLAFWSPTTKVYSAVGRLEANNQFATYNHRPQIVPHKIACAKACPDKNGS